MKNLIIAICLAAFCLLFFSGGCAGPGEKKGLHQNLGEGALHTSLLVYDVGAVFINTAWGFGTIGYGFEDGHTLLPLYQPETGKFEAHRF